MSQKTMNLYESLKAIFLHIDNHEKTYLSNHGLNVPRFYILLHVSQNPGINYIDLSDRLLCTKSNTTRVVRGMIQEDLITRQNDPNDGRSFQLFLTEKGRDILENTYPGFVSKIDQLMSAFSDEESKEYLAVSQKIESSLTPDVQFDPIKSQVLGRQYGRI